MKPPPISHKVWINKDGIIEVKMGPSITLQNLRALIEGSYLIAESIDERGEQIFVIADVTAATHVDAHIVSFGRKAFQDLPFTRMAMFGAGPVVTAAMNTILAASSKRDLVHMFRSRKEAEKWLGKPKRKLE